MLSARPRRLVARHAVGHVHPPRQPQPVEQVERAVFATPTSSPPSRKRSAISFAVTLQPRSASVATTAARGPLTRYPPRSSVM